MSPSVIALGTVSSTAILSSAIVMSLSVVDRNSNDARMTRWPLSLTAPLLHQSGDTTAQRMAAALAAATMTRAGGAPVRVEARRQARRDYPVMVNVEDGALPTWNVASVRSACTPR